MADRLFKKGSVKKSVNCLCRKGQNGDPAWKKSCSWDFRGDTWTNEEFKTIECKDKNYKLEDGSGDDDIIEDKFEFSGDNEIVEEKYEYSVWGVNSDGEILYKSTGSETDMWESIQGPGKHANLGFKQIEVGNLGVFGVDSRAEIYYRVGTNNNFSSGTEWQRISAPMWLAHVSVGDNSVWGVDRLGFVHEMTNIGFDDEGKLLQPRWVRIDTSFTLDNVSVHKGSIWGVNIRSGSVYRTFYKRSTAIYPSRILNPKNGAVAFKQVEISELGVFCVDFEDNIFYRVGTHNNPNTAGIAWQKLDGKLNYISSGHSTAWGVDDDDSIFKMVDISFDDKGEISFKWQQVEGKLKNVSIIENEVEPSK